MSLISEARMEGRHARRDGIARTACPPEFQLGRDHGDWRRGWDFEDGQIRAQEAKALQQEGKAA